MVRNLRELKRPNYRELAGLEDPYYDVDCAVTKRTKVHILKVHILIIANWISCSS